MIQLIKVSTLLNLLRRKMLQQNLPEQLLQSSICINPLAALAHLVILDILWF